MKWRSSLVAPWFEDKVQLSLGLHQEDTVWKLCQIKREEVLTGVTFVIAQ